MSEGSWSYVCYKIEEVADRLKSSPSPIRRAFGAHLQLCAKAVHDIEWVDSGDLSEGDDIPAIRKVLEDTTAEKAASEIRAEIVMLRDQLTNLLELDAGYPKTPDEVFYQRKR